MKFSKKISSLASVGVMIISANANAGYICDDITYNDFKTAVEQAYDDTLGFGFGLGMWATLVDRGGKVCYVYSVDGASATNNGGYSAGNTAWLGSRIIAAQKANTANAFSLDGLAISTGAISAAVYPGGSLYGLQHSNPVDASEAYEGPVGAYGTASDPIVGKRLGGINVFGGGVALYTVSTKKGAVGVSGDTSCRDHTMAYRLRTLLGYAPVGFDDSLALVDVPDELFEQPACGVNDPSPDPTFGIVAD